MLIKDTISNSSYMKRNNLITRILQVSLLLVCAGFISCNRGGAGHMAEQQDSVSQGDKPAFGDAKVSAVYDQYIHLKNALVNSDLEEAQSGAAALETALSDAGNKAGAELSGRVAGSSSLDDQRAGLDILTAEVEKVIKSAKLEHGRIYKQYCPMAQNGKGAYWLSSEQDIKNPYYGNEMLECGEVKEEIK